jgi:hypothetical protein
VEIQIASLEATADTDQVEIQIASLDTITITALDITTMTDPAAVGATGQDSIGRYPVYLDGESTRRDDVYQRHGQAYLRHGQAYRRTTNQKLHNQTVITQPTIPSQTTLRKFHRSKILAKH